MQKTICIKYLKVFFCLLACQYVKASSLDSDSNSDLDKFSSQSSLMSGLSEQFLEGYLSNVYNGLEDSCKKSSECDIETINLLKKQLEDQAKLFAQQFEEQAANFQAQICEKDHRIDESTQRICQLAEELSNSRSKTAVSLAEGGSWDTAMAQGAALGDICALGASLGSHFLSYTLPNLPRVAGGFGGLRDMTDLVSKTQDFRSLNISGSSPNSVLYSYYGFNLAAIFCSFAWTIFSSEGLYSSGSTVDLFINVLGKNMFALLSIPFGLSLFYYEAQNQPGNPNHAAQIQNIQRRINCLAFAMTFIHVVFSLIVDTNVYLNSSLSEYSYKMGFYRDAFGLLDAFTVLCASSTYFSGMLAAEKPGEGWINHLSQKFPGKIEEEVINFIRKIRDIAESNKDFKIEYVNNRSGDVIGIKISSSEQKSICIFVGEWEKISYDMQNNQQRCLFKTHLCNLKTKTENAGKKLQGLWKVNSQDFSPSHSLDNLIESMRPYLKFEGDPVGSTLWTPAMEHNCVIESCALPDMQNNSTDVKFIKYDALQNFGTLIMMSSDIEE